MNQHEWDEGEPMWDSCFQVNRTGRVGRSGPRRFRGSGLLLAIGLVLTGCAVPWSSTENESPEYAETMPALGEAVDFSFYTHCGVESAQIGGIWWHATHPIYGDQGPGDSPKGWGNPYQQGRLTVLSAERAEFLARGVRVVLVPSSTGEPVRICR